MRLFAGVDENSLAALAGKAKKRHFRMGETVFRQGQSEIPLVVVGVGCLRLEKTLTDTEVARIGIVGEGEAAEELSFASGRATRVAAVAIEETEAVVLAAEDFVGAAKRGGALSTVIIQNLAASLREASDKISGLLALDASARLAREFISQVDHLSGKSSMEVRLPLSQEDLARRIGTRRETVNRCLKELRDDGVVVDIARGRYRVDIPALYRTAGFSVVRTSKGSGQ